MATEEELYAYLGYAWIPPGASRERRASSRRRARGRCPVLVERARRRRRPPQHTDWSDGKATLEEMVAAARARGYRYLADLRPREAAARRPARAPGRGDREP